MNGFLFIFFSAVCCIAAVKANSADIKSTKKEKTVDNNDRNNDKIKASDKNDQKGNKDQKDSKKEKDDKKNKVSLECDNDRSDNKNRKEQNERKGKENDRKEKESKGNRDRKDNDRREDREDSRGDKDKKRKEGKDLNDNIPCGKPVEPVCNTVCLMIADPLCASPDGFDGESKTFDNGCQLDVYNCQNPKSSE